MKRADQSSERPGPSAAGARDGQFQGLRRSSETLEAHVAGLDCALCARRLTRHLRALPGVESAIANPQTGVLRVRHRPDDITAANVFVEVRRAGFVPDGERAFLKVSGMHCTSCTRAIEQGLLELPGVERVSTSLETGEVRVDFTPGKVTRETMTDAIARLGYRVET